ncbi:DUF5009 domain-containing protein [Spirosoma agri]|uniref:DUF5009 domain-containing protein n=1 Tax=Spirosoma agri TaxID=1987381 RepID=A0A6M0IIM2_9BACT|nr:DUF5009 domain-containing protein [Spirosoma agri]NEU68054.1 DUF5009 domain-containing protein [Spirosoma agri]
MIATPSKTSTVDLSLKRVFSIDVFRALTMLTMIFVNDFWTLSGIPGWLEHAHGDQDFLGFSDVVFPCFLFIVGMSIPFAIRQRLDKGDSYAQISRHVILRSIALLVMGVFTVNTPDLNAKATGMRTEWFQILMVLGFFLIWNQYPRREGSTKTIVTALQGLGVALVVFLAVRFRGGTDDKLTTMTPQWWGILGLIGWTYLTCALLYLFAHKRPVLIVGLWLFFTILCIAGHAGWLRSVWSDGPNDWVLGNGAFASFSFAGILATRLLTRFYATGKQQQILLLFVGIGLLLLVAGFLSRHFFIISKIQATPTWIFLCCGIAFCLYAGIYWLVDLKGKAHWFDFIKPAGTSTLTCYLIPYVYYSVANLSGLSLPHSLTVGTVGLLKSFVFALVVIAITAVLGRLTIKLKL